MGLDPGTPESRPEPKAYAQLLSHPGVPRNAWFSVQKLRPETVGHFIYLFILFCLFIHEKHRESQKQAEGEAGSLQGAQCGTGSQDPEIMT